ncbi:MAG: hypothetical protein JWQ94_4879, partial [Tardiphaga sp.]|nr:hypothetical protein [Tardiphaga sp.]
ATVDGYSGYNPPSNNPTSPNNGSGSGNNPGSGNNSSSGNNNSSGSSPSNNSRSSQAAARAGSEQAGNVSASAVSSTPQTNTAYLEPKVEDNLKALETNIKVDEQRQRERRRLAAAAAARQSAARRNSNYGTSIRSIDVDGQRFNLENDAPKPDAPAQPAH